MTDGNELEISALIPDVSEYPSNHLYIIFAPDDAPASVAKALSGIADAAVGKTIVQLLEITSRTLESADVDGDQQMLDSQPSGDELAEADSDDEVDDFFPDDDDIAQKLSYQSVVYDKSSETQARIRYDLLWAKSAGFKVGYLGNLQESGYVTLSCRIAKLGISVEAMQAWQIEPTEYLIVIFSYPHGYKSMDTFRELDPTSGRRYFGMRIGISSTYKPTIQEATRAFTKLSKEEEMQREQDTAESQASASHKGFRHSFISRPLHDLLNTRFSLLLESRYNDMSWGAAEEFYHHRMSAKQTSLLFHPSAQHSEHVANYAYPSLVTADHITEAPDQKHSLPLVAMQFILRHFVRCTEFCLICFRKMPDGLQAIKPYVCDNPLCLYQYMSLGFGPSIEHEIISQPRVVDLLISFCYTSARAGKLADFPKGLSLMVPKFVTHGTKHDLYSNSKFRYYQGPQHSPNGTQSTYEPKPSIELSKVMYSAVTREIIFKEKSDPCPLRAGDWIVILTKDTPGVHCRISDVSLYPTVTVTEPITPATLDLAQKNTTGAQSLNFPPEPNSTPEKPNFKLAMIDKYDRNFDDLSENDKRMAICALLDVFPSVAQMKDYLLRMKQSQLSSWVERMSSTSLALLRWIIASNRACIMQVENCGTPESKPQSIDRIYGMPGWSQFRFAMGAPDKERRFIKAVRQTSDRLHLTYPTLFAWHGSPLQNWHSIIREGLHFKDTTHGRAYGHGVYHSLQYETSLSYTGGVHSILTNCWPLSELRVGQALALNEIVAAPQEYVSHSPHLVVSQLDWIQTRYLFVKTISNGDREPAPNNLPKETPPTNAIEQDSFYTPRGILGSLAIPRSAVPSHRGDQDAVDLYAKSNKRRKTSTGTGATVFDPIELDGQDDDGESVATLEEDRILLEDELGDEETQVPLGKFDADIPTPNSAKGKGKVAGFFGRILGEKTMLPAPASLKMPGPSESMTDYVPGTLDYSLLPMLEQPAWATTHATKRLMQDFKQLIDVQRSTPPHELGWHIDEDKIENLYQWIIELHSFDPDLPLAKDMKTAKAKSIVLEMRFGRDYPMIPPFVRVVTPRFLGFNMGGGGHVTAGGALCMEVCIPRS